MLDLIINSSITHSLLLVLPIALAAVLRWARCRGWAVIGGAIAGILLGPTVLGRVAPDRFERHFVGAVAERQHRDDVARRHGADRLAATAAGLDESSLAAMDDRHARETDDARATWEQARWSFQRPFRNYTALIVILVLLGGGRCRVRDRAAGGVIAPLSIGAWSALVPGGLAWFVARMLGDATTNEAMLVGAAVGIGPWVLGAVDRTAANEAEFGGAALVQAAGRVASALALGAAAWALFDARGASGLLLAAPLLALPAGWLVPAIGSERVFRVVLDSVFVPSLAACVALRIELFGHFGSVGAVFLILLLIALSADGRWVGALLGALIPGGRRTLRTMRLVLGASTAGVTQLVIAAIAAQSGALPGTLLLALLFGAIYAEACASAHRWMARMIKETEEELD